MLYSKYAAAQPLDAFLGQFGSETDRSRWRAVHDQVCLTDAQRKLLSKFRRDSHVLVLAKLCRFRCLPNLALLFGEDK